MRRRYLALIVACGLALVMSTAPAMGAGIEGTWNPTGAMGAPRAWHTATLLADGRVLVTGGYTEGPLASAEVYDPATGLWNATGGMAEARVSHTATILPDGRVLVAGGSADGVTKATAEVWSPATGLWTPTGSLLHPRQLHTATLLEDGRVLVAAGTDGYGDLQSAEIYDPDSGVWTATGSLHTGRRAAHATGLEDGRVLVEGGLVTNAPTDSAEVYDPESELWTTTGSMETIRYNHSATLLSDGRVLVAGGTSSAFYPTPLSTVELYDPATGLWEAGSDLLAARLTHSATLLPDGQVVVAGGIDADLSPLASGELYDPDADAWHANGSLGTARGSHSATLLADGRVLAAGGSGAESNLDSAEIYSPESSTMHVGRVTGWMSVDEYGRAVLVAHVRAVDGEDSPLGGVHVDVSITAPGAGTVQRTRITKPSGYARFVWGSSLSGEWMLCVDDMTLAGYVYEPDDNVVTCREWQN